MALCGHEILCVRVRVYTCGFGCSCSVRSHQGEAERRPHDPHQRSEVRHLAAAPPHPHPPALLHDPQTGFSDSTAAANKGSRRLIQLNS